MAIKRANHNKNMKKSSTNFDNKEVHDRITLFASSKLLGLFNASKNFKCLRRSDDTWRICRYGNALTMAPDRHIPKFNVYVQLNI